MQENRSTKPPSTVATRALTRDSRDPVSDRESSLSEPPHASDRRSTRDRRPRPGISHGSRRTRGRSRPPRRPLRDVGRAQALGGPRWTARGTASPEGGARSAPRERLTRPAVWHEAVGAESRCGGARAVPTVALHRSAVDVESSESDWRQGPDANLCGGGGGLSMDSVSPDPVSCRCISVSLCALVALHTYACKTSASCVDSAPGPAAARESRALPGTLTAPAAHDFVSVEVPLGTVLARVQNALRRYSTVVSQPRTERLPRSVRSPGHLAELADVPARSTSVRFRRRWGDSSVSVVGPLRRCRRRQHRERRTRHDRCRSRDEPAGAPSCMDERRTRYLSAGRDRRYNRICSNGGVYPNTYRAQSARCGTDEKREKPSRYPTYTTIWLLNFTFCSRYGIVADIVTPEPRTVCPRRNTKYVVFGGCPPTHLRRGVPPPLSTPSTAVPQRGRRERLASGDSGRSRRKRFGRG